jgi:hypothetical protein
MKLKHNDITYKTEKTIYCFEMLKCLEIKLFLAIYTLFLRYRFEVAIIIIALLNLAQYAQHA